MGIKLKPPNIDIQAISMLKTFSTNIILSW